MDQERKPSAPPADEVQGQGRYAGPEARTIQRGGEFGGGGPPSPGVIGPESRPTRFRVGRSPYLAYSGKQPHHGFREFIRPPPGHGRSRPCCEVSAWPGRRAAPVTPSPVRPLSLLPHTWPARP